MSFLFNIFAYVFRIIHLHCNIDITNIRLISYINVAMKMNNLK